MRRDGDPVVTVLSGSARPIRDAQGKVIGAVALLRDVTQQRQLDERLRTAQRLEALGQLTGGVAHDFNNLLTVITGALALIPRRPDDVERDRQGVLWIGAGVVVQQHPGGARLGALDRTGVQRRKTGAGALDLIRVRQAVAVQIAAHEDVQILRRCVDDARREQRGVARHRERAPGHGRIGQIERIARRRCGADLTYDVFLPQEHVPAVSQGRRARRGRVGAIRRPRSIGRRCQGALKRAKQQRKGDDRAD